MSMSSICPMKGNVMQYFKPGEQMRMMYYSVMTQANSEKEYHSEFPFPSLPVSLLNNTLFSFVHQALNITSHFLSVLYFYL